MRTPLASASSEWVGYEASNVTALGNWNAWIPSNEVAGEKRNKGDIQKGNKGDIHVFC